MAADLRDYPSGEAQKILVNCARQVLSEAGYQIRPVPQPGRGVIWQIERGKERSRTAVRTTRDRWFAFNPSGTGWKTLDDVERVVVVALAVDDPGVAEVFLFPAETVRGYFDDARQARLAAHHRVAENMGMWICLDPVETGSVTGVGSGIAATHRPIGRLDLTLPEIARHAAPATPPAGRPGEAAAAPAATTLEGTTIAEVMAAARRRIAALAGVPEDAVSLKLRIEM